ncbi:transcription factor Tfb4 [Saitoella complicata NRRL Y-17804]|uniref:transcription factor Tfb4 n=1 Tax=Saitoella complicata (strain BCRC 22490 / CBS 7301 / JCM 7358 / NBRC 10748 / NRRL Y-17804) TaxID=698492 RepID=UPI0008669428|nr:transcription factor Tfb4 [Saitoella complicata NRRL Y-17804]ODQ53769.1 transcription factor Tfb4 [Saitoella complicata NRRL Y-17804]
MDAFKTLPQGIEASQPNQSIQEDDTPSLLVVILDTNPFAWGSLSSTLPLEKALAQLLIFVNAHLALSHDNRVAVLASHIDRAEFLYPDINPSQSKAPAPAPPQAAGEETVTDDTTHSRLANSYRPFRTVDDTVHHNLRSFLSHPTTSTSTTQSSSLIAGALTRALTYINRVETEVGGVGGIRSRVFVLSVSGEGREGYVAMMNCIFAAQKKRIPIDVCSLTPSSTTTTTIDHPETGTSTSFLQQAADATSGLYLPLPLSPSSLSSPSHPLSPPTPSLLQYLLHLFLPPPPLRPTLLLPLQSNVDFRAACFCHKRVVEIGWVCGVCLSIFCGEGVEMIKQGGGRCGTCGTEVGVEGGGGAKKVGAV